ncbi:uncharacterized protein LOC124538189 [Vanessa cardui]|uniref:uncharacterized protein LOC124538189 n=1 Tax=Vanessa cardui TaxID=171605 RepID=UPI001F12CDC4|nr:uncharacterized protein LOC124538189 [Vanessa cardui]
MMWCCGLIFGQQAVSLHYVVLRPDLRSAGCSVYMSLVLRVPAASLRTTGSTDSSSVSRLFSLHDILRVPAAGLRTTGAADSSSVSRLFSLLDIGASGSGRQSALHWCCELVIGQQAISLHDVVLRTDLRSAGCSVCMTLVLRVPTASLRTTGAAD